MRDQRRSSTSLRNTGTKIHSVMSSTPTATMNSYRWESSRSMEEGRCASWATTQGTVAPAPGSIGQPVGVRRHKFPVGCAHVTSYSPGITVDKQISHLQPLRNLVNTQRCHKETRTKFFPGHAARARNPHELAANNKPSIEESKEATGPQLKRPPKGAHK